ncbi:MAG: choice-of-anchor B family protein [Gemmatimonadota bacterium]|nr:choice-of-anchor B family protein [Gemmatimonadota bacterium]
MTRTFLAAVLCGLTIVPTTLLGQTFRSLDETRAPFDVVQGFGGAVAVGDGEVFVGEGQNQAVPGKVFVYRRDGESGWREAVQLMASDGQWGDGFGSAVSVDGATLLIGATNTAGGVGSVYVFTKDASGNWVESATIDAEEGVEGDGFGASLAVAGDLAFVGAPGRSAGAGAVYVFKRNGNRWNFLQGLAAPGLEAGDRFGLSLAVEGHRLVAGAPGKNRGTGTAFVYRSDESGNSWMQEGVLEAEALDRNAQFGRAVAAGHDHLIVGAPGNNQFTGVVILFEYDEQSAQWEESGRLTAFDGVRNAQFGGVVAHGHHEVWVGAMGSQRFSGRAYLFRHDENEEWVASMKIGSGIAETGDRFATTLAFNGNVGVIGALGDDYGAGTATIVERDGEMGHWRPAGDPVFGPVEGLAAISGDEIECAGGEAELFGCQDVNLLAFVPVADLGAGRGVALNDIWGWTDPETGREYAIVGRTEATVFVDVTEPSRPVYVGQLYKPEQANGSVWRDIKVYRDHAFIVADGAGNHGMQVFDLRELRGVSDPPVTFEPVAHYEGIASAHNVVINEATGFAYTVGNSGGGETCGGGSHMINLQDPANPVFAGCFAHTNTGRRGTGYTHDAQCVVYDGPDEDYRGREICFGANETALSIADVTDKDDPIAVARAEYPNVGYSHQGWLTEDHRIFYMNDELDEIAGSVEGTRTLIWDVTDLDDPILLKEHISENRASDHNLYVRGNLMYQSNYQSGLRILDVSDPGNPVEVAFFDTVPYGENEAGMGGSWSNYPYFESGTIVVTSRQEGLFILKRQPQEIIP